MKKFILEFIHRGMTACGFGPLVLVILYLILQQQGVFQTLTVNEVCLGIVSLSVLAFISGGMNSIYQIEQLPLMIAILIHGSVLYISYLTTYLINRWLEWSWTPIFVFTAIFICSYLIIWVVIYSIMKKRTNHINEILKLKQQKEEITPNPKKDNF